MEKRNEMRISINGVIAAAAGLSLFAAGTGAARADILPAFNTPTIVTAGGVTTFTYNVLVSATQELRTNNFFTIYDFNFGTLAPNATVTPTNGTFATMFQLLSPPVVSATGTVTPNDNPALFNATFTYTGPTVVGGPLSIGTFALRTSLNGPGVITAFAGSGTDQGTGLLNGNVTNTLAPSVGAPPAVPEPGTVAFLAVNGVGMAGMMFRARRRSKRSTAAAA